METSSTAVTSRASGMTRAESLEAGQRRNRIIEALIAIAFVAPATIILIVFNLFPVLYGFFLSMQDGVNIPQGFVGLDLFITAVGSFAYVLALVLAMIFALGGYRMYKKAVEAMQDGQGNFYPYLLPAYLTAASLMLAFGLTLGIAPQLGLPPLIVTALGAALYWRLQVEQNRRNIARDRLLYLLNSFFVATFTLCAVLLVWFTFSEIHERGAPMLDVIRRAMTDSRYNYVVDLYSQILALLGISAAVAAVFAIWAKRRKIDPTASPAQRSRLGLLMGVVIGFAVLLLIYILGAQELLRLSLIEFAKVPADQLRAVTRFRTERVIDQATEWQQVFSCVIGLLSIGLAWFFWNSARRRESSSGMLTSLMIAICLLAGGWLFVGELPAALAKGDLEFYQSVIRTVIYACLTVPVQLSIGLVLAYLLYYEVTIGKSLFRLTYFTPYIAPTVATATVFAMLFSSRSDTGPANLLLGSIGLPPQEWLRNPKGVFQLIAEFFGGPNTVLPAFMQGPALPLLAAIVYGIWVFSGYNAVIFMAGFGNVPKDVYEAAAVDGAGRWDIFRQIIFPLISPTTFMLSLLAIIGTFRAFNHIWVLRTDQARGAMDTTTVYIFTILREPSVLKGWPYAASMSFLLFGIILILTLIQNRVTKDRVFYG